MTPPHYLAAPFMRLTIRYVRRRRRRRREKVIFTVIAAGRL